MSSIEKDFDVMLVTNRNTMIRCQSFSQLEEIKSMFSENEKIINVKHLVKSNAPKDQMGLPIPPPQKQLIKE